MSKVDRLIKSDSPVYRKNLPEGLNRREFLKAGLASFAALTFVRFGIKPVGALQQVTTLPNGVASGEVTQTGAVLWTRSTTPGTVTFEYAIADDFENVIATLIAEVTDPMIPVKVELSDLTPATDYFYRVMDSAGTTAVGAFRTAAEPRTFAGLRFGVTGDWRGELAPYPSIANIPERELAFLAPLGDTIYADFPSPDLEKPQARTLEEFRIKHNEGYSERFGKNYWAEVRATTPIMPTIDDHEVGNDFAGGAPPSYDPRFADEEGQFVNDTQFYKNGIQAFQEYNPIREETWGQTGDPLTANKVKLYRYFTYGSDAAVFILDSRSFRSTPLEPISDFENLAEVLRFVAGSFDQKRSMLGMPQLEALTRDLLAAQEADIFWKFVFVPEPLQNLGVVMAQDRFEGYAAERTALLKFINDNDIQNVVFVAADIHGTVVNDITYQERPSGEQLPTGTFEITTGSVAFDAPFGITVVDFAYQLGLITEEQVNTYKNASPEEKEAIFERMINAQIEPLKYPSVGLEWENVELLKGRWLATHTYGWTEFDIDAETHNLHITTYGIPPYSRQEIFADPEGILSRKPEIVQEFVVKPLRD